MLLTCTLYDTPSLIYNALYYMSHEGRIQSLRGQSTVKKLPSMCYLLDKFPVLGRFAQTLFCFDRRLDASQSGIPLMPRDDLPSFRTYPGSH